MKFQNPSFKIFFERTDGRTNKRTDKPKAICSPLFQSWGHNYCRFVYFSKYMHCDIQFLVLKINVFPCILYCACIAVQAQCQLE